MHFCYTLVVSSYTEIVEYDRHVNTVSIAKLLNIN